VKVTEVMTVNRKAQSILLEYECGEGVAVVEELREVIRRAVGEWFGERSHKEESV
jgi:hypothetical protein